MAARKKKTTELSPQPDASAALDGATLLKLAEALIKELSKDLLARAKDSASVAAALKARHEKEKAAERTADNYDTWRRNFTEQVAAAWFLSCAFVRTLEDRGLLDRARLAGPGAMDSQRAFFALMPSLSERDYLLTVFRELCHLPAAEALFDARHNPVWLLGPSAEAARKLLEFFRTPNAEAPAFRFGGTDTRFLGDLYQDLSENVRKRYALLQTPRFVERFILDRTLTPAIERFGLEDTTLIDPTCGSGHFLLGGYDRLFDEWLKLEPAKGETSAATKALAAVHGSDINPYAVAIAKFRLTLSFLEKGGFTRLKDARKLPLHVVVADSLLHNPHATQLELGNREGQAVAVWKGSEFLLEDEAGAREVLHKTYAAVVGNPPYITVKDAALRERYRDMYPKSTGGKYSLAAPFCERFFQLGRERGYVGMITANSFMKREFGKKLIQEYLPSRNLTAVINTSGAYIPGHGTPTVLLFGTAEAPQDSKVLTVLASRGEPSTPEDPEQGLVWSSVAEHSDNVGFENDYISVTKTDRDGLKQHPWSLGGGGATDLKELLEERAEKRLGDIADSIGIAAFTLEDDVYLRARHCWQRSNLTETWQRPMVTGEMIRDWSVEEDLVAFFPYGESFEVFAPTSPELRLLWPWRTCLANNKLFGGKTKVEGGLRWYEFGRLTASKLRTPLTITFAFVATHNHFVLDRGGKVFNRSAPIIKLPPDATEDDHFALLAYLNSSTACFWMKQECHNKTNASQKHTTDPARAAYEFAGTALQRLPVPRLDTAERSRLADYGKKAHALAEERAALLDPRTPRALDASRFAEWDALLEQLIPIQEEIDWLVYAAFGLCESTEGVQPDTRVPLGARPFELETGYRGGFSARVGFEETLIDRSRVPREWLLRAELIKGPIAQLEKPEFKRPWRFSDSNRHPDEVRAELLQHWRSERLLNDVEQRLASESSPGPIPDKTNDTQKLIEAEAIPFLAFYRYTDAGLEKYAAWEATWALQRREDDGETVTIDKPPEYSQGSRGKTTDFRKSDYWRLRGKLDVPKERFISYPGCESDEDGEPVYGWAGWDQLQRAKALAELYRTRKDDEGWAKERLMPMLAGLLELMPWLNQWHNEPSDELGGAKPAEQFSLYLDAECAEHGFTHDDLRHWRPPEKARKQSAGKKAKKQADQTDAARETP